jgi:hypothetical protein
MLPVGKKIKIGDIIKFDETSLVTFDNSVPYYNTYDYWEERCLTDVFFNSCLFKNICELQNVNCDMLKDIYINKKKINYNVSHSDYLSMLYITYKNQHRVKYTESIYNQYAIVVKLIKEKDFHFCGRYICKDIYGNYIYPKKINKVKQIKDVDLSIEQYIDNFKILRTNMINTNINIELRYTEFVRYYNLYWINRL